MPVGLIDTNIFLHAQSRDALAGECLAFLASIERGDIKVRLEVVVLHELSYALPRLRRDLNRPEVAEYLLAVLAWPGVTGDTAAMIHAVRRWRDQEGISFVDAYLASLARRDGCAVYTKNLSDFRSTGVELPSPLPH